MHRAALIAAASAGLALASPGHASAGSCTIEAVSSLVFGAYGVFDPAPLDSTGTIAYRCSDLPSGATVMIELSTGLSGSYGPRTLENGPHLLGYNLYLDAARTQVWGDGTGGSAAYGPAEPPDDEQVSLTVYGEVPAHQDVSAGSYEDTITVTILF